MSGGFIFYAWYVVFYFIGCLIFSIYLEFNKLSKGITDKYDHATLVKIRRSRDKSWMDLVDKKDVSPLKKYRRVNKINKYYNWWIVIGLLIQIIGAIFYINESLDMTA